MKNIRGIFIALVVVYVITAFLNENFLGGYNQGKLLERTGLYGILSLGVAFVIITGGIDLSIGAVVCLVVRSTVAGDPAGLVARECGRDGLFGLFWDRIVPWAVDHQVEVAALCGDPLRIADLSRGGEGPDG